MLTHTNKTAKIKNMIVGLLRNILTIFRTGSPVVVGECQRNFNFLPIKAQLTIRTAKFLQSFTASENTSSTKHRVS